MSKCTIFKVSVDALGWEFHVSTLDDSNITEPPKVSMHACSCL